ncbi:hypothetical protein MES4922_40212 [Mesorhizobium ventifaucium]|uniref:Extensin-like C-terminal domain-containing protein n=1 Tax=Mesorhizobium ventifaucium TaxID=666020 RepID=A0ABN8K712_9HYPH|nr:hypothetical protein MES4922_40212 [Mesorhizobium ventifaucium]
MACSLEHAYGNALDVAGFGLADGRHIDVRADVPEADAKFLDAVRKAAYGQRPCSDRVAIPNTRYTSTSISSHAATARLSANRRRDRAAAAGQCIDYVGAAVELPFRLLRSVKSM